MMVDIPIRASYRCFMVACQHLRKLQWNPIPWEGIGGVIDTGEAVAMNLIIAVQLYIKLPTREAEKP